MADVIFPGQTPQGSLGVQSLPGNMDLSIWRGDAQTFVVALTDAANQPISLAGRTAAAVIRATSTSTTKYAFTCTIQNSNQVKLYMSSAVSSTIPAGSYIWSFETTDATGDVRTYLAGDVIVYDEVPQ